MAIEVLGIGSSEKPWGNQTRCVSCSALGHLFVLIVTQSSKYSLNCDAAQSLALKKRCTRAHTVYEIPGSK